MMHESDYNVEEIWIPAISGETFHVLEGCDYHIWLGRYVIYCSRKGLKENLEEGEDTLNLPKGMYLGDDGKPWKEYRMDWLTWEMKTNIVAVQVSWDRDEKLWEVMIVSASSRGWTIWFKERGPCDVLQKKILDWKLNDNP